MLSRHELPETYCGAFRELLERTPTLDRLQAIWARNAPTVGHLRTAWPDLKTANGAHYAELLQRIYEQRVERLNGAGKLAGEPHLGDPGTPELPLATPKRLRDSDHLQFVASQPCIVCGRTPSHAHHIRFAQPRAMGAKVSDEFTVPICFLHHRALHDSGSEETWWQVHGTDPLVEAKRLWQLSRNGSDTGIGTAAAINGEPSAKGKEEANAIDPEPEAPLAAVAE